MSDVFDGVSDEFILRSVKSEIERAKDAQKKGRPLPKMKLTALIMLEGEINRVKPDLWEELGYLLLGYFRGKRGRPSTKHDDIRLARKYFVLRGQGKKDAEAIEILAADRNHTDPRSTRKALARGKKLWTEEQVLYRNYLAENGIDKPINALALNSLGKKD